ncbi:MAG: hypothetical protein V1653_05350, partial [bacterium]
GQLPRKRKEQVEKHLKNCNRCQAELANLQKLDKILMTYPAIAVSANFTANFWAKVRDREQLTMRANAYFYRWAAVILLFGLLSGVIGGIYSANLNAKRQFITSINLNHLSDYPPDSLGGKAIVLASLK